MGKTETQVKNNIPLESRQLELLISSIVEFSKQRERFALEDCFSRLISTLTGSKVLTIFHLQLRDGETYVSPALHLVNGVQVSSRDANIRPFPLSSRPDLAEILKHPFVPGDGVDSIPIEKELILPLQGATGEVAAYCRLENAHNDPATQRLLPLLLEFYLNYLALINDNERDMLTGLLNRKTFDQRITKLISSLQSLNVRVKDTAEKVKYHLAVLDIDHFKQVNDTFGHIYGDEVLLLFANMMQKTFRDNDMLFRFGGEEFVVLLANEGIEQTLTALERFRSSIENHRFPQVGKVTVSIGVAQISAEEMALTTIDRADQALYYSKEHGRNQIRVFEELVKEGHIKVQTIQTGDIELF